MVLVANKIDLSGQRKVTTEEGRDLANKFHCPFLETSAAHRSHVDEVFHTLGKPYVLGSSSILTCRVSNICYCFPLPGAVEKIKTNIQNLTRPFANKDII